MPAIQLFELKQEVVNELAQFVQAQPREWQTAKHGLLPSERQARIELIQRLEPVGLEKFLQERSLDVAQLVDALAEDDRETLVRTLYFDEALNGPKPKPPAPWFLQPQELGK
jgi:hypothetical protein